MTPRTFGDLRRRRIRRAKAMKFHLAQIANHVAWAPFYAIEDLGSAVPGALLFDHNLKVSDYTWIVGGPLLGS